MKMQGNNKLFDHFTPRYDCRRTKERYREECGQQKTEEKNRLSRVRNFLLLPAIDNKYTI